MMSEDPHLSHKSIEEREAEEVARRYAVEAAVIEKEEEEAQERESTLSSSAAAVVVAQHYSLTAVKSDDENDDEDATATPAVVEMRTVRLSDATGRVGIFTGIVAAQTHFPLEGTMVYESDPQHVKFVGHWDPNTGAFAQGQVTYRSGDVYTGTFDEKGRPSGSHGHYLWAADGQEYKGDFIEGYRHGKGVLTWPNGSVYQGSFVRNVRTGPAIYHAPGGIVYHGSFQQGVYHGYGEYQGPDKSVFRGTFDNGKPHGHGVLVNQNGDIVHDGEWEHGKPFHPTTSNDSSNNNGGVTHSNKTATASTKKLSVVHNREWTSHRGRALYRGLWDEESNCPTGHGTIEYGDATRYEGCLDSEGQWHGTGRWSSVNGDVYEGNFEHGERHGFGIYTWSDGRQYQGSFERNLRQGQGVLVYPNQDLYEGEFQQGQRHGHGSFTFSNGAAYKGEWEAGLYSGRGTLVQNTGKTYEGQFCKGLAHGQGCEWDANGKVLHEGWWNRGQPADEPVPDEELNLQENSPENVSALEGHSGTSSEYPLSPVCPPPAAAPPPPPISTSETLPLSPPVSAPKSSRGTPSSTSQRPRPRDLEKCKAVVDQPLSDAQGNAGRYTGIVVLIEGASPTNGPANGQVPTPPTTMMPHGVGRMVYADGKRIHEGFWKHGNKEGHGRCLFFPQGDWHEGEYVENMRQGPGKYHWKDGRLYEGNYENDYRHGHGIFSYPTNEQYVGNFVKGQRSGHGRFEFADGAGYYEGEWKAGKYHGKGKLHVRKPITESLVSTDPTKNFLVFEGDFVAGVLHGYGTKTDLSTGDVDSGDWFQGQLRSAPDQESSAGLYESGEVSNASSIALPPEDTSEHLEVEPPPIEDCPQTHAKHLDGADEDTATARLPTESNLPIEVD